MSAEATHPEPLPHLPGTFTAAEALKRSAEVQVMLGDKIPSLLNLIRAAAEQGQVGCKMNFARNDLTEVSRFKEELWALGYHARVGMSGGVPILEVSWLPLPVVPDPEKGTVPE